MPASGDDLKKFSNYGRMVAVLTAIGYPALGIYSWFTSSTTNAAVYCTFISPIIALIEVPTCCACFTICKSVDQKSRFLTRFWFVRMLLYVGVTAGFWALADHPPFILMLPNIALDVAAFFYLIATLRREPVPQIGNSGAVEYVAVDGGNGKGDGGSGAGGIFGVFKKGGAGSAAAGAAASAAAPSLARQYFGGSDPESTYAPPVVHPHGSSESLHAGGARKDTPSAHFTGGSLFSGSKGYDMPEANPFG